MKTSYQNSSSATRWLKKLILGVLFVSGLNSFAQLPLLKISSNKRFFTTTDGKPFFWLGDTGWLLFVKCNREDALQYLDARKKQGFNVVQVMVLHDMNNTKNVYGDYALLNEDVSKPNITAGKLFTDSTAYDYWDHVDFIVDEAAKRGIYMAMVPIWGSNVKGGKVSVQQGEAYARFLARRYRNRNNIIWLNGGDVRGTEGMEVWQIIGATLKKEDGRHLITFHPRGRTSSSDWFHQASWLDFNIFQSGHKNYAQDTNSTETRHYGEDNWRYLETDYQLQPVKPSFDAEPSYENIPQGLHDSLQPRWTDADIRRYAYWNVFAGGPGFTYGENAVMQFNTKGDWTANYGVRSNWKESLQAPGATQMIHLKKLLLSKSYFDRVPAQELVAENGERYDRVVATRGKEYALFYVYNGRTIRVKTKKIGLGLTDAYWFNPRTGAQQVFYKARLNDITAFTPPGGKKDGNDWVLIIERSKAKVSW